MALELAACVGVGTVQLALYFAVICFGGIIINRLTFNNNYGLIGFQAAIGILTLIYHVVYFLR